MRILPAFLAALMAVGFAAQAPALSGHALEHALERVHSPITPQVTTSGCDLCQTFHTQASILVASSFVLPQLAPAGLTPAATPSTASPLPPRFFRARAPPAALRA